MGIVCGWNVTSTEKKRDLPFRYLLYLLQVMNLISIIGSTELKGIYRLAT